MSATTYIYDLDDDGQRARIKYGAMPWRCKVGRGHKWHYAATADEALAKALPTTDRTELPPGNGGSSQPQDSNG